MSTHVPGFQIFLHHFVLAKFATGSIRVKRFYLGIVKDWREFSLLDI